MRHILSSPGGIADINANIAGADFVGVTLTINTLVDKILGLPSGKEPDRLKKRKSLSPE